VIKNEKFFYILLYIQRYFGYSSHFYKCFYSIEYIIYNFYIFIRIIQLMCIRFYGNIMKKRIIDEKRESRSFIIFHNITFWEFGRNMKWLKIKLLHSVNQCSGYVWSKWKMSIKFKIGIFTRKMFWILELWRRSKPVM
jgi:hypothetical protein